LEKTKDKGVDEVKMLDDDNDDDNYDNYDDGVKLML